MLPLYLVVLGSWGTVGALGLVAVTQADLWYPDTLRTFLRWPVSRSLASSLDQMVLHHSVASWWLLVCAVGAGCSKTGGTGPCVWAYGIRWNSVAQWEIGEYRRQAWLWSHHIPLTLRFADDSADSVCEVPHIGECDAASVPSGAGVLGDSGRFGFGGSNPGGLGIAWHT